MKPKILRAYVNSAGALLLAASAALVLINITIPADLVQPQDPFFLVSVGSIFWVVSGINLVMAIFCLLYESSARILLGLVWLAINLFIYRIALYWNGCHGLGGLLSSVAYVFPISPNAVGSLFDLALAYLLGGSITLLTWNRLYHRTAAHVLKMACPSCGVHIKFAFQNIGQNVHCPQCLANITLRKHENLKMACFFCKEHIEFPAHALGQKIKCPHCDNDITLKEPAVL